MIGDGLSIPLHSLNKWQFRGRSEPSRLTFRNFQIVKLHYLKKQHYYDKNNNRRILRDSSNF